MVEKSSHERGILVGFSNSIETAKSAPSRLLAVGLHGAPVELLYPKRARLSYGLELESFFWSISHIALNRRRGIVIDTLATAEWHQGQLKDMQRAKDGYLRHFGLEQKAPFTRFSRSLGATHTGFFTFVANWAEGLKQYRFLNGSAPDYDTVVTWLREAIAQHGASQPT